MSYGEWIRRERKRLRLTQRELGEQVGVTDGYLSHVEQELRVPSLELAVALAHALGLSPGDQGRFLQAIDAARVERSRDRLDKRREALSGALARPPGTAAPAGEAGPAAGAVPPEVERLARQLDADPELAAACRDLIAAYADPELRDAVLKTLRGLASSSRARGDGALTNSPSKSSAKPPG